PEAPERPAQPQGHLCLAGFDRPSQRRSKVVVLDGQAVQPLLLGRTQELRCCLLRQPQEELRGHLREGRERLEAVLTMPAASTRNLARARVLNAAGALAHDQGDLERAAPLHEEGLAIARECGDEETIAYSL